jgi:hypothetical protein
MKNRRDSKPKAKKCPNCGERVEPVEFQTVTDYDCMCGWGSWMGRGSRSKDYIKPFCLDQFFALPSDKRLSICKQYQPERINRAIPKGWAI